MMLRYLAPVAAFAMIASPALAHTAKVDAPKTAKPMKVHKTKTVKTAKVAKPAKAAKTTS